MDNCGLVFVAIVLMIHTADALYNCGHIFVSIVLMIHTVDIPYSCRIVLVYIVLMNHDVYGFVCSKSKIEKLNNLKLWVQ
jgi:hypothetical protein